MGSIPAPVGLAPFEFMALYTSFSLVCIPAPKLVAWLGPKLSMIVGAVPYLGLVVSFLSPGLCAPGQTAGCWGVPTIWAVKISMGVLVGCSAGVLWTGQGVYLANLAAHAVAAPSINALESTTTAEAKGAALGVQTKKANGTFYMLFQFSGAVGLVASSAVLASVKTASAVSYLFLGLSVCCLGGVLVLSSLPKLTPLADGGADGQSGGVSFAATLTLCLDARMALVIPMILYNGLSIAFMW